MTTHPSELFTVAELARRWRLSESYLRHLIADGVLPVIRIGRAVRISCAMADQFARDRLHPRDDEHYPARID